MLITRAGSHEAQLLLDRYGVSQTALRWAGEKVLFDEPVGLAEAMSREIYGVVADEAFEGSISSTSLGSKTPADEPKRAATLVGAQQPASVPPTSKLDRRDPMKSFL